MKKIFLAGLAAVLVLGSCDSKSDALDGISTDSDNIVEDIHDAVVSFGEGGATNGDEYFSGILSAVVEVDVKIKEIDVLDNNDATEVEIKAVLDSALHKIKVGTDAMNLYKNEDWPQRAEFHILTLEWFDSVDGLVNNYLYQLAEPMSRPDETWTDEEIDLYDEYSLAREDFNEIDGRWVDFQYTFAAANDFTLSGFIDEDEMVEQEVNADTH